MEERVEESVSIAKRMGYDHPQVLEIIAAHHEMLSGEGYPRGKEGDEIPLTGRRYGVAEVADVYCALTSRRSFRDSWEFRFG